MTILIPLTSGLIGSLVGAFIARQTALAVGKATIRAELRLKLLEELRELILLIEQHKERIMYTDYNRVQDNPALGAEANEKIDAKNTSTIFVRRIEHCLSLATDPVVNDNLKYVQSIFCKHDKRKGFQQRYTKPARIVTWTSNTDQEFFDIKAGAALKGLRTTQEALAQLLVDGRSSKVIYPLIGKSSFRKLAG